MCSMFRCSSVPTLTTSSLRGGTTWQSPMYRAALYVGDCHSASRRIAMMRFYLTHHPHKKAKIVALLGSIGE
jgi:hypothetical protein